MLRRGPTPRYCRPAHRQRAHEARRPARDLAGALEALAAARRDLADGLDPRLAAAIDATLVSAGLVVPAAIVTVAPLPAPAPNPSRDKSRADRRTGHAKPAAKPWKAVRYRRGHDPSTTVACVYSAHATEHAARAALQPVETMWVDANSNADQQWAWTVIHDPTGGVAKPVTVTSTNARKEPPPPNA